MATFPQKYCLFCECTLTPEGLGPICDECWEEIVGEPPFEPDTCD